MRKLTSMGLATPAHVDRATEIDPERFYLACLYPKCKVRTQFGSFGMYSHTRVVHGIRANVRARPLTKEEIQCHFSSPA